MDFSSHIKTDCMPKEFKEIKKIMFIQISSFYGIVMQI